MIMLAGVAAVAAVAIGAVGVASGATSTKCGTLYTPVCTPPTITTVINAKCHKIGSTVHLPPITVKGNAGIKKIVITLKGRKTPIETINGGGATKKTISGITIHTRGLKPGSHAITIKVTDVNGKTTTKTVHIAICVPKPPPFTG